MKKLFTAFLVLGIFVQAGFAYALKYDEIIGNQGGQVLAATTTGLVSYWNLDQGSGTVANDAVGARNGTLSNNGPVWTTGKLSGGLQFDGTDDQVSASSLGSGFFSSPSTITAWLKSDSPTGSWKGAITQGNNDGGFWWLGTYNGAWQFYGNAAAQDLHSSAITAGTWYHVAVAQDSGSLTLYVNGQAVATAAASTAGNTGSLYFGRTGAVSGEYFAGAIDEVRAYSRALSAQEILDIYNDLGTPDTQAPTTPTGLSAAAVSSSQVNLSWNASTDNVGVAGYRIFRNGSQVSNVTGQLSFNDTGLSASTNYSYTVAAYDGAGNASSQSSVASATTPATPPPDTQAPAAPTGLSASAVSSSQVSLAWSASTDNVGVTGYRIFRCSGASCTPAGQVGTSVAISYTDNGLSASTLYRYAVAAVDAAGNVSSQSAVAQATTQAGGSGNIRQVGSGQTYSTIAACISAAQTGDICNVNAGTYTGSVTINKSITLRANLGSTVILQASGSTPVVTVTASNVTVDGFDMVGNSTLEPGIVYCDGCSGLTVQNNTLRNATRLQPNGQVGQGIYTRNATNLLFQNNLVYGNIVGMNMQSCHSTNNTYATGCRFLNNTIHDNPGDGIEVLGAYITIAGNTIYNNIDSNWESYHPDGIQLIASVVDGFTGVKHALIYNNTIRNHNQNIFSEGVNSGQSSDTQDIWIFNNVVYNDSGTINGAQMDVMYASGFVIKFTRDAYIFNNYIGRQSNVCMFIQDGYNGSIHIKNNICNNTVGDALRLEQGADVASGELDYNIYNAAGGNDFYYNGTFYSTFSSFRSAVSSQEANGINASPLVGILPSPTLQTGSPAINAGVNLTSACSTFPMLCTDRASIVRPSSGAWEIGPYEFSGSTGDTTAPSMPTGLSATAVSSSQINLSWTASTDNVAVVSYTVYRSTTANGTYTQIGTAPSSSYQDSNLTQSTAYYYKVTASDAAGNTSAQSSTAQATTPAYVPIAGDLNNDRIVNSLDYSLLNGRWNQSYAAYDLNTDGIINSIDFAVMKSNWGKTG